MVDLLVVLKKMEQQQQPDAETCSRSPTTSDNGVVVEAQPAAVLDEKSLPDLSQATVLSSEVAPLNLDATPEQRTTYHLEKVMEAVSGKTNGREVLKELWLQLKENPETEVLLLPDHVGAVTQIMQKLTTTAHTNMTHMKAERTARATASDEKKADIATHLGDLKL